MWSRGHTVFSFDPVTRSTTNITLEHDVMQAAYGPDGRALAYIASTGQGAGKPVPWHLQVGTSPATTTRVDLDIEPGSILGWRDTRHVVVSDHLRKVRIVDVVSGEVEPVPLSWGGDVRAGDRSLPETCGPTTWLRGSSRRPRTTRACA